MKQLLRRLSRVADSSHYVLLRSGSHHVRRSQKACRTKPRRNVSSVPEGFVPVYVGEEMERFMVSAYSFNHPVFLYLLERSAEEYGYEQKGVLRIPCRVLEFEKLLKFINDGVNGDQVNIDEICSSLKLDFC